MRAIQERAVRPVGSHHEEAVDVRILSASHRDLAQWVAENRFRQDLYFRINVITLRVPALRERPEDIPDLAAHVLVRLAERDGTAPRRLSPAALAALQQYAFPGNVRELENLLERACALCESEEIGPQDIDLYPTEGLLRALQCPDNGEFESSAEPRVPDEDGDEERTRVLRMLDETRWNRSAAARRLGMTLRQLRYRLQKWGME